MKHPYSNDFTPAALVMPVRFFAPGTQRSILVRSKIDTAADFTVIPNETLEALRLAQFGTVHVHSVDALPRLGQTYWAGLEIERKIFETQVIAHRQSYALLGRDVLNELVLIADGPRELFWFGRKTK